MNTARDLKKKVLVTTSIEETWLENAHIVFLGEWCKKYSRKDALKDISHETLPFHWKDRNKFNKDSIYLRELHEILLKRLQTVLNDYHHTNYSLRYWRIVIGPWLAIFIPAVYDRWEQLKNAMKRYDYDATFLNKNIASDLIRADYLSSAICLQDDGWNHSLYSDIIEKEYAYLRGSLFTNIRSQTNKKISKSTFLKKLISALDIILSKIKPNYNVAFISSYLDPFTKIILALKLGQFPRSYSLFDQEIPQPKVFDEFRNSDIELKATTPFERYISKSILQLLPSSYLECFADVQFMANRIPDKVHLVFTANAHFSNDIFKIWCANQVEYRGTKLLVGSHGGALPSEFSSFTDHEEAVADKRIVWHSPLNTNQVQLPANKFVGIKKSTNVRENKVTLIGLDLGRYSYGMQSGPCSSLMLLDFEQKKKFILSLVKEFNRKIGFYPAVIESWEHSLRINDFLEEDISNYSKYNDALQKSKLIICSYPQTTLSDALFSGVPFVLLYTKEYWTFPSHFKPLVEELEKAKIIFSDPILAAEHVNSIWDDPEEWWSEKDVQKAKQNFLDECLLLSKNGADKWHKFLSDEIKKQV